MQTMAFTTIADLYPPAKRGRVIGFAASVFGLSSVIGPLIGGFLTDGPGWRYAFYVNLPVGFVALAILYFCFPHIRARKAANFQDRLRGLPVAGRVHRALPARTELGRPRLSVGLASDPVSMALAGVLFAALFVFVELRAAHPIVDLALFRNSIVSIALSTAFLTSAAMFGATLFIPLFVQSVLGSSATESGQDPDAPHAVASAHGDNRGSRHQPDRALPSVRDRGHGVERGRRVLAHQDGAFDQLRVLVRNVAIIGIGLGAAMPVFNLAVQNAVEARMVGSATSMVQFVRSIGGTLGIAVLGSILSNDFSTAFRRALPAGVNLRDFAVGARKPCRRPTQPDVGGLQAA